MAYTERPKAQEELLGFVEKCRTLVVPHKAEKRRLFRLSLFHHHHRHTSSDASHSSAHRSGGSNTSLTSALSEGSKEDGGGSGGKDMLGIPCDGFHLSSGYTCVDVV